MSKKRRKPKPSGKACLKVMDYKGEKVFVLGGLRFDQISPFDVPPSKTRSTEIRVMRNGEVFDTGQIAEFGTHDGSDYFMGLKKICPRVRRSGLNNAVTLDNLKARSFKIGDEVCIACPAKTIRSNIVDHWQSQVLKLPKFALLAKQADKDQDKIIARMLPRGKTIESLTPEQAQRLFVRSMKEAWRSLDAAIAKLPMPDVIHRKP